MSLIRAVLIIIRLIGDLIKTVRFNKIKGAIDGASKNKDQKSIDDINDMVDR